jgi:hypothetical protein
MKLFSVSGIILLCFACLLSSAQVQFDDYFDSGVLRIDYQRKGNAMEESIHIVQWYFEEEWSGNPNNPIEPYDYGDYKIELYDSETKKLIFKFSYSSLFAEYIHTVKGQNEIASFEETVRLPLPRYQSTLYFYKRNKQTNQWHEQDAVEIKPLGLILQKPTIPSNTKHQTVFYSGKPQQKVDFAIIAEGYTIDEAGKFFEDATKVSQYIINCKPFALHKDKINVWAVFSPSKQSGVTDPSQNIEVETAIKSNFSTFGTDRYLMTESHFDLRNIASTVPYDHLIVLVNSDKYGGGGIYNFYATCTSNNEHSDFLVVHEIGHSFAGLADEYWTSDVSVMNYYNIYIEPIEPNITSLVEFHKKWKDMIDSNTPIPTPDKAKYKKTVGVFEGAGYRQSGLFRPYMECTMKSVRYNEFCPVCVKAIEKIIFHFHEE